MDVSLSRPRPPRLICPPLRPATLASSEVHSCAVPLACAARPPLLAISRCFSGDIDAKPRRSLRAGGFISVFGVSFMVAAFLVGLCGPSPSSASPSASGRRKAVSRVQPEDPAPAPVPVHPAVWAARARARPVLARRDSASGDPVARSRYCPFHCSDVPTRAPQGCRSPAGRLPSPEKATVGVAIKPCAKRGRASYWLIGRWWPTKRPSAGTYRQAKGNYGSGGAIPYSLLPSCKMQGECGPSTA